MTIRIFTDGSSRGNPGRGGWGAIVVTQESVVEIGGREDMTTNNRMELSAVALALEVVPDRNATIVVYIDSEYVIKGLTTWIYNWERNGWQTTDKRDVLNKDLWQRCAHAMHGLDVSLVNVKGHAGVVGNERADVIATSFADNDPVDLFNGKRNDYSIPIDDVGVDANKVAKKKDKSTRNRGKAYSYVSLVDGEVCVHKTWAECEARVKGKSAKFKKAISKDEEDVLVKEYSQ